MHFSINAEIACAYGGSDAALILQYFFYWIRHNKKHNKNYHDGRYWTYNSLRELGEKFPFMSTSKIRSIIGRLVEGGILTTGNYNKHRYDRTLWYAFKSDEIFGEIDLLLNPQMDFSKQPNPSSQKSAPIPTSKQIQKQEEVPESSLPLRNTLLRRILLSHGLSKTQATFILKAKETSYIINKIRQLRYIMSHFPEEIQNEGKYLYCSLRDNWEHQAYITYLVSKKRPQKQRSLPDIISPVLLQEKLEAEAWVTFQGYSPKKKEKIINIARNSITITPLLKECPDIRDTAVKNEIIRWVLNHETPEELQQAG